MFKRFMAALVAVFLFVPISPATTITRQHTFQAGRSLQALWLEDEFNNAVTGVNGNDTAIQTINTTLTSRFTGNLLNIANGGTGASSASAARTALGAAASGANSDITSLSGLTTPITFAQGGTGLSSATANSLIYANSTTSLSSLTLDPTLAITTGSLGSVADTSNQRVGVALSGSTAGTRKTVNFIPGTNVTMTVADNSGSNRVDVTVNASSSSVAGTVGPNVVILEDQKATNTAGGTSTTTTWVQRVLNTKVVDTGSICTLTSNQFTLPAGTYRIHAEAPAALTNGHQIRLRNITDTTTTLVGIGSFNNNATSAQTNSVIDGRFTIAGSKTFEIDHWVAAGAATTGFGVALNTGEISVFTRVIITQEN